MPIFSATVFSPDVFETDARARVPFTVEQVAIAYQVQVIAT